MFLPGLFVAVLGTVGFAQETVSQLSIKTARTETESVIGFTRSESIRTRAKAPAAPTSGDENNAYVSFKTYIFKVTRSDNDVAVLGVSSPGSLITDKTKFDFGTSAAYKAEAGWQAPNRFGFRGSYFFTFQDAQENRTGAGTAPFFVSPRPLNLIFTGAAFPGTPATYKEDLRMDVADLEGTYNWTEDDWTVLVSGGVRIARVRQLYRANDNFGSATNFEALRYEQKRTGFGPTGALEFKKRLGTSNLWFTGSGRFAAIFGSIDESAQFDCTSCGVVTPVTRSSSPRTWVVEGEAGVEWKHKLSGGNELFFGGSFIIHNWHDVVIATPTNAVGGDGLATLDPATAAPTQRGSVRFLGGGFSAGFRF